MPFHGSALFLDCPQFFASPPAELDREWWLPGGNLVVLYIMSGSRQLLREINRLREKLQQLAENRSWAEGGNLQRLLLQTQRVLLQWRQLQMKVKRSKQSS